MSEINIEVAGGSSVRLPTAGKYCDRNIVVTATGGGGADFTKIEDALSSGFTDYSSYFLNGGTMTEVPIEILKHTASGKSFKNAFSNCSKITAIPQIDVSSGTDFTSMFSSCSKLSYVPKLNTSKGTTFSKMFEWCSDLTTVEGIDISRANSITNMFSGCNSLENITFDGVIKITGLSFGSNKLTHTSLMSVINALYDWVTDGSGSGTYTLTLGSKNLAKLTDAEKAIATQKGWTLA